MQLEAGREGERSHLPYWLRKHTEGYAAWKAGLMIKLVLTDMDNTLIPWGQSKASPRAMEGIREMEEEGIRFAPASGRDFEELKTFFADDLSVLSSAITANGLVIRLDGRIIQKAEIEPSLLLRLDRALAPFVDEAALILYDQNAHAYARRPDAGAIEIMKTAFPGGVSYVSEWPDIEFSKLGIAMQTDAKRRDEICAAVSPQIPELDFVKPLPNWVDVVPHGVNKATAIKALADALHITMDEICAFGDSENDIEMLEAVGYPVVVANASPAAKAAARYFIPAAAEDSVGTAFLQIAEAARTGVLPDFLQDRNAR